MTAFLFICFISGCANRGETAAPKQSSADVAKAQEQLTIKAVNYQFDQSEYHIKKGVPTEISLTSEQGNHGVSIKELAVRLDRKHPNAVVTADKAGTFEIACSIPCGPGHKDMKAKLVVD